MLGLRIAEGIDLDLLDADFKAKYDESEQNKKLIDTAMALEGMPRNISIHAAGIVITEDLLHSYVPLSASNGVVVTQYDMDTLWGYSKSDPSKDPYGSLVKVATAKVTKNEKTGDILSFEIQ